MKSFCGFGLAHVCVYISESAKKEINVYLKIYQRIVTARSRLKDTRPKSPAQQDLANPKYSCCSVLLEEPKGNPVQKDDQPKGRD